MGAFIAVGMFAIFLISMYVRTVMTRELFERMMDLSIIGSVFCFAIAVLQQIFNLNDTSARTGSTFLNANYYATIIEFVVLFCVYRLINRPDAKKRLYYASIIFINICGLYLCDCRSAFLVLFVTIAVYLAVSAKAKALYIFLAITGILGAAICFIPGLFPRGDQMGSDFMTRLSIWETSLKGIMDYPVFGKGGGTYALICSLYGGHTAPHAHSIFLDPILNFGIVGVGLFAVYVKENARSLKKLHFTEKDRTLYYLVLAILLSVLLHGLMDITVFGIQTGLLFTMVFSVAGICEAKPKEARIAAGKLYGEKWPNS